MAKKTGDNKKPNILVIFGDDIGMVEHRPLYPPSQGADSLSLKKNIEMVMKKLESPHGSSN